MTSTITRTGHAHPYSGDPREIARQEAWEGWREEIRKLAAVAERDALVRRKMLTRRVLYPLRAAATAV